MTPLTIKEMEALPRAVLFEAIEDACIEKYGKFPLTLEQIAELLGCHCRATLHNELQRTLKKFRELPAVSEWSQEVREIRKRKLILTKAEILEAHSRYMKLRSLPKTGKLFRVSASFLLVKFRELNLPVLKVGRHN